LALPFKKGQPVASLQLRSGSWRVIFRYRGSQHFVTVGEVDQTEAQGVKSRYEYLLRLLKQRVLTVPSGMDIVSFLRNDGKPPDITSESGEPEITFAQIRDGYLKTIGNGAVEKNTLYTSKIHLAHIGSTLGERFLIASLAHADLQRHVTRRSASGDAAAVTIKKELDTLRSAWNWAKRMGYVPAEFPGAGLVYPKGEEKLPFMTWTEIERRIAAGGDPEELWECLFLREPEIASFLDFVQQRKAPVWVYPMCVMAAHTGARRSEMLRAERQDVDLETGIITIREKKRVRGKVTTRRVPISARLKEALAAIPLVNGHLFGELSLQAVQNGFMRVVGKHKSGTKNADAKTRTEAKRRTKWSVMKGYHVLRHSFISALANKGVDQRIIDELVGHQTEAMRRRYRHLYPQTVADAVKQVFG
jgi:integrase